MSASKTSIISISLVGVFLSGLLYFSSVSQSLSPEQDQSAAESNAQLLREHINENLIAIKNAINALSFNTYWQSAAVAEWPYWLKAQESLYQAAGLSLIGVHSSSNNVLYLEDASRPGKFAEFSQPLKRLYQTKKPFSLLLSYKDQPSIVLLSPIKDVNNEVIGSLVGIKKLDNNLLKQYHFFTKVPVVLVNNGQIRAQSIESNININNFTRVNVVWPSEIQSSLWQLSLLIQEQSFSWGILLLVLGLALTVLLIIIVNKQLQISSRSAQNLQNSFDIQLPAVEQVNRLNDLYNTTDDPQIASTIQAIRLRLEKSIQSNKSSNLDVRKLKDQLQQLKRAASSLSNERDSAIAAPRLKSEFLSRMGDEITTPMKSVVSMLKLLSEYQLDAEAKQILNIAKRSTRTLVDNLNNILDFSKLDAGMLKLTKSQFSVRELVDDLASELSHYANEKGLSLQASTDPELPSTLSADKARIRQILRNLLGNAVRFTKDGEVKLYADILQKDEQQFLRFTVSDTGVGIPTEAQKGLFDSLEQSTKLNNSSFAGRLRLIVSKNLSELMGGEIGVISESGKGSQFWFTVKLN
jgi:two-component system, NarL family, sensor histidine kinase BarA